MRPISWLHISDIHMNVRDAWSQDIVLTAMCERIEQLRTEGVKSDFILATGDLAFSGKADEYTLVADFFAALREASGVPTERIFCVPGNHDIDRERQKLCFKGARLSLTNENLVDELLVPGEDLDTLLAREENYLTFQNTYFDKQDRASTQDGLSYVSHLVIDDIHIAIVGLDSVWLAEGGLSDHGNLLIGERQVINAIELTRSEGEPPHIVLSMAHHPCHLLKEFDRQLVQGRIERACHFFHCGHLHVPEMRAIGQSGTGCLSIAAGASFETRQSQNTFSVITVDLFNAKRFVRTFQYQPTEGSFAAESRHDFRIEVAARDTCAVGELAGELCAYCPELRDHAAYLAALLLDQKAEFPIPAQNGYVFGAFAVLAGQSGSELKEKTSSFMAFRNVLRALYGRTSMQDILARHGEAIAEYGALLAALCAADASLQQRLAEKEQEAQSLAGTELAGSFAHTAKLLDELAEGHEWDDLREHARRHLSSSDEKLALRAQRLLALALAHSDAAGDRAAAIELYQGLADRPDGVPTDLGNLATLLLEDGKPDDAKEAVIQAIQRFPATHGDYFADIGHRVIESTGDRDFRKRMKEALPKRGKSD